MELARNLSQIKENYKMDSDSLIPKLPFRLCEYLRKSAAHFFLRFH
jgi:hypothetical protein